MGTSKKFVDVVYVLGISVNIYPDFDSKDCACIQSPLELTKRFQLQFCAGSAGNGRIISSFFWSPTGTTPYYKEYAKKSDRPERALHVVTIGDLFLSWITELPPVFVFFIPLDFSISLSGQFLDSDAIRTRARNGVTLNKIGPIVTNSVDAFGWTPSFTTYPTIDSNKIRDTYLHESIAHALILSFHRQ